MTSRETSPPDAVVDGLKAAFASIWRWSDEGKPEFVCLATNIGRGRLAVTSDAGIRNQRGNPHGPFSDLYVSLIFYGGAGPTDLIPVKSVYDCAISPVCILTLDLPSIENIPTPPIAAMGAMEARPNTTVWRMGFADGVFADQTVSTARAARVASGYTNRPVSHSPFRGGSDPLYSQHSSIVVDCCFDYPGRCDFGAPVCDVNGHLAGVLVGHDTACGYTHIGYYVPIEIILPFIDLENALGKRRGGVFGIHEPVNHSRF